VSIPVRTISWQGGIPWFPAFKLAAKLSWQSK